MLSPIRIGINLLTCSLAHCPLHVQAAKYALDSLLDSDIQRYDWHLVVVDNASTCPHTIKMLEDLEAQNERVTIEWADTNLGITGGRNLGYQTLHELHQPQYVIEAHTDHVFPETVGDGAGIGWLQPIIDYMEDPRFANAGIVGPSLLTSQGYWGSPRPRIPYQLHPEALQDYITFRAEVNHWARVWRQPGLIRPGLSHPAVKRWSMLEQIGTVRDGKLFCYDPDMPGRQNFEDTEEAYRADAAGWLIQIHFGSLVYHHYHLTRLGLSNHGEDYDANNLYVQQKHTSPVWDQWGVKIGKWMEEAYTK